MRKSNHTEIVCIIDRSGSMSDIKNDAIGGFNSFLESQKKLPGSASLSLALFDHEYLIPFQNRDIQSVEPLTDKTFVPRGQTALFDAVGRTINEVGARLAATPEPERPEKVLVCIVTDGEENSSRRFSRSQIREMIEHQRGKYNWEFAFLAADQDAFAEAESMGISAKMAVNFERTPAGARIMSQGLHDIAREFRADVSLSDEA
jgi:hypothetical protein